MNSEMINSGIVVLIEREKIDVMCTRYCRLLLEH
jgi:hypothetical protein